MSAAALEDALAQIGCAGHIEAHGRLAVLVVSDPARLADERLRRAALRVAQEHGFTHLAVELNDSADAAAVHRAEPPR